MSPEKGRPFGFERRLSIGAKRHGHGLLKHGLAELLEHDQNNRRRRCASVAAGALSRPLGSSVYLIRLRHAAASIRLACSPQMEASRVTLRHNLYWKDRRVAP